MLPFFVARHKTPAEDKKSPPMLLCIGGLHYTISSPLSWERAWGVRLLNKNLLAIYDVDAFLLLGEALACNVVDDLVACLALN